MKTIDILLERNPVQTQAVLNILLESAYFYRSDAPSEFAFLRSRRDMFEAFFEHCFGWQLVIDGECARVYKKKHYNKAIPDSQRTFFRLAGRNETIAFLLLVEYFEYLIAELHYDIENELPRFIFGNFLERCGLRFRELFPGAETYGDDQIRKILKPLFNKLEQFRFISLIKEDRDGVEADQDIYQMLPALYHYDASELATSLNSQSDSDADGMNVDQTETETDDVKEVC